MLISILAVFVSLFITFVSGMYLGYFLYRKYAIRRMHKLMPLLKNAIISVMLKYFEEGLSREEAEEHMRKEMDFIDVIMGQPGE